MAPVGAAMPPPTKKRHPIGCRSASDLSFGAVPVAAPSEENLHVGEGEVLGMSLNLVAQFRIHLANATTVVLQSEKPEPGCGSPS